MNALCCSHQMTNYQTRFEYQFKNHQNNIRYTVTKLSSQFSAHSLKQEKLYDEVNFHFQKYDDTSNAFQPKWIEEHCYGIKKRTYSSKFNSNCLVVLHIINKAKKSPITLLVSHDHVSTLGTIYPFLIDLSTQLKCDVISYDYSGYGLSSGHSSDSEANTDLEAVLLFCFQSLLIFTDRIILFGIGLGALPTLSYVSQQNDQNIKAIILLSPILASKANRTFITNDNEATAAINCPVLLIHGKANTISDYLMTQSFAKQLKTVDKWYPSKGSYTNIPISCRAKFYLKLKEFCLYIQPIKPKAHYMTTPLFKMQFNDHNSRKNSNSNNNLVDYNKYMNSKNNNFGEMMHYYSSSRVSSSNNESSRDDNCNNNQNNNTIIMNKWNNYNDSNNLNSYCENSESIDDNDIKFLVHKKDSNMILNTIRSLNYNPHQ